MNADGYTNILSMDYSDTVIRKMKAKYAAKPELRCMTKCVLVLIA